MNAQPDSSGGLSRDYIVEYRAGQFQNGSLVLRFDPAFPHSVPKSLSG